ncbi:hypothetical protein MNBD_GAMMA12-3781 [hydrothermal vent metagenome]|uniref:Rhombotarget lipoprotein n=1 Tax=hydrothermal vent metagenome TaxID=652676 RepID=A0A3B0Y5C4_9ZZZZ
MFKVKSRKQRLVKYSAIIAVFSIGLSACNTLPVDSAGNHKARSSSSLVGYIYPNGETPAGLATKIPKLTVPVKIGIAFVPEQNGSGVISERVKDQLLRKVRSAFKHHAVVQEIRLLPVNALRSGGGFRELRQVAQRHNIDLVALVSHNQVRAVRHNALSVSYLTIIGAIILPGNSHQVSTLISTAVFDINSGKLLFHAAGKDRVRRQTSAFALAEKNTMISRHSIAKATGDMIASLNTELSKFRTRIRRGSQEADIKYRRNYRGKRVRGAKAESDNYYNRQYQQRDSRRRRNYEGSRRAKREDNLIQDETGKY